jgi:hypothetical protein
VHAFQVVGAESVVPDGSGRITRIARARAVVSRQKLFAYVEFFAHLLQAWIGERHGL